MPKICTEKFSHIGKHMGRSTSRGKYVLDLHFSVQDNNFYFERKDIEAIFPDVHKSFEEQKINIGNKEVLHSKNALPSFRYCYTRKQAVLVMESFLRGEIFGCNETKMLVIDLAIPEIVAKTDQQPEHIQKMLDRLSDQSKAGSGESRNYGIALQFKRVYKFTKDDTVIYTGCFGVWEKPNLSDVYYDLPNSVEWTVELEAFLIKMQKELERICLQTLAFLKTDSLLELNEKIKTHTLALNPANEN